MDRRKKTGLLLTKNLLKLLAKSILIPLGFTVASSAADTGIHKEILGSGMTILTISNEEIGDIMKIVKSVVESSLLIEDVSKMKR